MTKSSGSSLHIGKTTIVTGEIAKLRCGYSNFMQRIRIKEDYIARFYWYIFNNELARKQLDYLSSSTTGLANLNATVIGEIICSNPPKVEQEKIVYFLDHETAKIDTLIDKQQQLIQLLKEKRQAVISHAVTKGLNPNAPMRDSGVEWLGEVPEHWEVSKIKYVLNLIGDVDHYMPQTVEQGIPYVMTGDLKELVSNISLENCKQVSHNDYFRLSKKIKTSKGDVILARYATIGTVSYVDIDAEFLVSYSCVTIKPDISKLLGFYLFYYFQSDAFMQGIQSKINTNTQGNVGINDLEKLEVALPSLAEQTEIINFLQLRLSKLNEVSTRAQEAIRLMQERRTALISAAVTGKIDVRNWESPGSAQNKEAV